MIYALDRKGVKVEAAPRRRGWCPTCKEELRARCGDIRIWHWGHVARHECDPWQECESAWHRAWKARVPPERAEVCFGEHRADILGAEDCVIELQHSFLSAQDIREREQFYGRMVWLLDGAPLADRLRVEHRGSEVVFSWAHARPSWTVARKPIFVHGFELGTHLRVVNRFSRRIETQFRPLTRSDDILQIRTLQTRGGVKGTGRVITMERFCGRLLTFEPPEGGRSLPDP